MDLRSLIDRLKREGFGPADILAVIETRLDADEQTRSAWDDEQERRQSLLAQHQLDAPPY